MIRRLVFCGLFVAGASFAAQALAQDVMFAYSFEEGSSRQYRVKLSQELAFSGNTMGQIGDFEVTLKCLSVADGVASMELVFDKADMMREMFGNQAADPLADMLVGHGIVFKVDPSGEVSDIAQSGYYDGWDSVQPFVEPLVKGWFPRLPGRAHAPGGTWESSDTEKGADGTDVKVTAHYTYKENKKQGGVDCASVTGDLATEVAGTSVSPMGTFQVEGGGKGKFEFLFDPAARAIVKLKSRMTVDMDLTPRAGGDTVDTSVNYQMERELL
ncbi:MAG: hypothetical protein OEX18_07245 [Candidatus Krumholzibacteria bacterium]|nr:hypothetical protein [Candidatus Krumholzibacteria bacterium]MDH4337063.1 hypothetical protein [Candidatus Krumholzibacteria bacterium]MDH5268600.1 hypothetical protein [Candidatus Krumholzibacteria bacterium]MDH5628065.1 hypothetical protein [Candidatus Krumholzibacteria bacterium]